MPREKGTTPSSAAACTLRAWSLSATFTGWLCSSVAAGTRVTLEAVHDNSAENPRNPSSPPKRVVWGEQTVDEMSAAMLQLVPVREADMAKFEGGIRRRVLGSITTREAGNGRITHVGTVPNGALAREVLRWAAAGRSSAWVDLPDQVTSTGASSRDGRRLRFVHNWNWNPIAVASPGRFTDVLTGEELVPGQEISLSAWDVRVLVER